MQHPWRQPASPQPPAAPERLPPGRSGRDCAEESGEARDDGVTEAPVAARSAFWEPERCAPAPGETTHCFAPSRPLCLSAARSRDCCQGWLLAWKSRMANCKWPGIFKFSNTHTHTHTHTPISLAAVLQNAQHRIFYCIKLGQSRQVGTGKKRGIVGGMLGAAPLRGLRGRRGQRPSSVFQCLGPAARAVLGARTGPGQGNRKCRQVPGWG